MIDYTTINRDGLSKQISDTLREAIVSGTLSPDARLPSETELAERFSVSRPTVREALKRLAAQNLIRTQRGAAGGAFVNKIDWAEAYDQAITTATLLISMHTVSFETVAEARFALERACLPLAVERANAGTLATLRRELARQQSAALTDESFCASDVTFHRALVDAAANPVLSFQLAGAVEAMQPLMNMITYRARDRVEITNFHAALIDALANRNLPQAEAALASLGRYTIALGRSAANRGAKTG
tara:strand:+ start:157 stop:891 length:735 start_codon:yes stop_codon:yes gene_type:complete